MNERPHAIITPVYEDVEAAKLLFIELARLQRPNLLVIAVDDGSIRQPLEPSVIADAGLRGVVIRLRRNVGHQRAIAVGLHYVAEHMPDATCIVMDCDGEDMPATIPELEAPLASPDIDAAVAVRGNRVESLSFRVFYAAYKIVFYVLSGRRIAFGNFMALKPPAVRRLVAMQELWIHVAASVLISRLRIASRAIDRGQRYVGQSKMNFSGLVLHGFRALMVVTEDVLVRVGIACTALAVTSLLAILLSVLLKLIGVTTPGWFSTALGILVLMLLQTGALTLITLMLTGVVRGGTMQTINYRSFVDRILETHG